jgi:hypothetical protein
VNWSVGSSAHSPPRTRSGCRHAGHKTDLHVLRHVGLVGFEVLKDVTMLAEQAARRNPYERAGFDALRDTLAIAVTNKIIEASGLNP